MSDFLIVILILLFGFVGYTLGRMDKKWYKRKEAKEQG